MRKQSVQQHTGCFFITHLYTSFSLLQYITQLPQGAKMLEAQMKHKWPCWQTLKMKVCSSHQVFPPMHMQSMKGWKQFISYEMSSRQTATKPSCFWPIKSLLSPKSYSRSVLPIMVVFPTLRIEYSICPSWTSQVEITGTSREAIK